MTTSVPPMPTATIPSTRSTIPQTKVPTRLAPIKQIAPMTMLIKEPANLPRKASGEKISKTEPIKPKSPKMMRSIPPIRTRMYPTYASVFVVVHLQENLVP